MARDSILMRAIGVRPRQSSASPGSLDVPVFTPILLKRCFMKLQGKVVAITGSAHRPDTLIEVNRERFP